MTTRRLAAILAADVVGFTRLMGLDETGTHQRLQAIRRELIEPEVKDHGGRVVKSTGDGVLVEFASAVQAVTCAVEVQEAMAEHEADKPSDKQIVFRVGLNLGDLIIEDDDIHGDGVNIACRLEALCPPGGVCVSAKLYDEVRDKVPYAFEDMGEQSLKNVARPTRAYSLAIGPAQSSGRPPVAPSALPLPDKPSIAVLPFTNMSGDPEQEYFADGVVEDIITALSRFPGLFVIARNSSFTFKGRAVDVKQVGRDLGVRYVLEGSVRRSGDRLRLTGQLIDAATGAHVWADRLDGRLEDVFDLQDRVTSHVVGAIAPAVERAEIERSKRKPTDRLDSYDYYLRGMACLHQPTSEMPWEALKLFYKAIAADPDFSAAYGRAAWCFVIRKGRFGSFEARDDEAHGEALRLARRALELGRTDAVALCTAAHTLAYIGHDFDPARAAAERAVDINPNLAMAWMSRGWVDLMCGNPERAKVDFETSMRLSPLDPFLITCWSGMAWAHCLVGSYDEGCAWANRTLLSHPTFVQAIGSFVVGAVHSERLGQAESKVADLRTAYPEIRIADLQSLIPTSRADHRALIDDALRLAGVPE